MKTLARSTALFVVIALLAGCTLVSPQQTEPDIPPATISTAKFVVGDGYTVKINGEFFKMKSNYKADVMVSVNGANWVPASSIRESSPTAYTIVSPFGVAYPEVWVRVFGMNGKYTDPYMVHGWTE